MCVSVRFVSVGTCFLDEVEEEVPAGLDGVGGCVSLVNEFRDTVVVGDGCHCCCLMVAWELLRWWRGAVLK